jgi:hypothetical protein
LSLLLDHTILERTFSYPASSNTALTEEPALSPVPALAGKSFTKHALYFMPIGYGTVKFLVRGTWNIVLYASREALWTAVVTSGHFAKPIQIFHFLFHAKTVALNDIFLPHVVTLVTLLTSSNSSSNSFFVLSLFQDLIGKN